MNLSLLLTIFFGIAPRIAAYNVGTDPLSCDIRSDQEKSLSDLVPVNFGNCSSSLTYWRIWRRMCCSTTLSNARRAAFPWRSRFLNASTYFELRTAVDTDRDAMIQFFRFRDNGVLAASGENDCLERFSVGVRVGVWGVEDWRLFWTVCFLLAL